VILRSARSKGLHVIATGAVITQKQARMNAAFVQTMHKHFDHALGQATLDKIWDPGFTSLQIPGTTKNNSLDMDTTYAGHIASVDDMIKWSGIASATLRPGQSQTLSSEGHRLQAEQKHRPVVQEAKGTHDTLLSLLDQCYIPTNGDI
jgi:hypothetical protein